MLRSSRMALELYPAELRRLIIPLGGADLRVDERQLGGSRLTSDAGCRVPRPAPGFLHDAADVRRKPCLAPRAARAPSGDVARTPRAVGRRRRRPSARARAAPSREPGVARASHLCAAPALRERGGLPAPCARAG